MLWFNLFLLIVKPPFGFKLSNHVKKRKRESVTWTKASSSAERNNILDHEKPQNYECCYQSSLYTESEQASLYLVRSQKKSKLQVWCVNSFQKWEDAKQTSSPPPYSCIGSDIEICTTFHWGLCSPWAFVSHLNQQIHRTLA